MSTISIYDRAIDCNEGPPPRGAPFGMPPPFEASATMAPTVIVGPYWELLDGMGDPIACFFTWVEIRDEARRLPRGTLLQVRHWRPAGGFHEVDGEWAGFVNAKGKLLMRKSRGKRG